ncbi:MAG: hypothetical protein ACLGI2_14945 [Acidimicrobiia bacterium]
MTSDASTTQPDTTPPPAEGGSGVSATDEGADTADERQDEAAEGSSQQGRGRVQ